MDCQNKIRGGGGGRGVSSHQEFERRKEARKKEKGQDYDTTIIRNHDQLVFRGYTCSIIVVMTYLVWVGGWVGGGGRREAGRDWVG